MHFKEKKKTENKRETKYEISEKRNSSGVSRKTRKSLVAGVSLISHLEYDGIYINLVMNRIQNSKRNSENWVSNFLADRLSSNQR